MDSRTILDRPGANHLIGKGRYAFLTGADPVRVQYCLYRYAGSRAKSRSLLPVSKDILLLFFLPEYVVKSSGSEVEMIWGVLVV